MFFSVIASHVCAVASYGQGLLGGPAHLPGWACRGLVFLVCLMAIGAALLWVGNDKTAWVATRSAIVCLVPSLVWSSIRRRPARTDSIKPDKASALDSVRCDSVIAGSTSVQRPHPVQTSLLQEARVAAAARQAAPLSIALLFPAFIRNRRSKPLRCDKIIGSNLEADTPAMVPVLTARISRALSISLQRPVEASLSKSGGPGSGLRPPMPLGIVQVLLSVHPGCALLHTTVLAPGIGPGKPFPRASTAPVGLPLIVRWILILVFTQRWSGRGA